MRKGLYSSVGLMMAMAVTSFAGLTSHTAAMAEEADVRAHP